MKQSHPSHEAIPEARPAFGFENLWGAFWRCCEYCGTRAALRTVIEGMSYEEQRAAFERLEDESAGSWSFEEDVTEASQDHQDDQEAEEDFSRGLQDTDAVIALIRSAAALSEILGRR